MKRPTYYILDDNHQPVALTGPHAALQWGRWFEGAIGISGPAERRKDKRRVAFTDLGWGSVSTVFLGIDHAWDGGPPILFETMVFGNPKPDGTFPEEAEDDDLVGSMRRYCTWDEAEAGHAEMVAEVREKFWLQRRANGK